MRAWFLVTLMSVALVVMGAPSATAGNAAEHESAASGGLRNSERAHIGKRPLFSHRRVMSRHNRFNRFNGLNGFGFTDLEPPALAGGFGVDDVNSATGVPPIGSANANPFTALAPSRLAVDDRPRVETTPQGVVVVRGPGSHHTVH